MPETKTKLWYLRNLEVFKGLDDLGRDQLQERTVQKTVKRGEVLYFQGAEDDNIYILKQGAVKIMRYVRGGNEIILDVLGWGSVFGETADPGTQEKNESAIMLEDGTICTIGRTRFERFMSTQPGLEVRVNNLRNERRFRLENKLLDMLFSTVEERLARVLLDLMEDFGDNQGHGRHLIKVRLTHRDFAQMVASTRETVTATFRVMRERGLIDSDRKYVTVLNQAWLHKLAEGA